MSLTIVIIFAIIFVIIFILSSQSDQVLARSVPLKLLAEPIRWTLEYLNFFRLPSPKPPQSTYPTRAQKPMDPSSFASAAASLLALDNQILGVLYGDWDEGSQPLVERLTYELTQIRTVLQTLEITSLSVTEPIFDVSGVRVCLEGLRE